MIEMDVAKEDVRNLSGPCRSEDVSHRPCIEEDSIVHEIGGSSAAARHITAASEYLQFHVSILYLGIATEKVVPEAKHCHLS